MVKSNQFCVERLFPGNWLDSADFRKEVSFIAFDGDALEILERLRSALPMLAGSVEIDAEIRSGVPVLKNTRFPISHLFAEIANDSKISEIVEEWDLDISLIKQLLIGLSICLDRPFSP